MSELWGVFRTPDGVQIVRKPRQTKAQRLARRRAHARAQIRKFKPYREWAKERPRSADERALYLAVLRAEHQTR